MSNGFLVSGERTGHTGKHVDLPELFFAFGGKSRNYKGSGFQQRTEKNETCMRPVDLGFHIYICEDIIGPVFIENDGEDIHLSGHCDESYYGCGAEREWAPPSSSEHSHTAVNNSAYFQLALLQFFGFRMDSPFMSLL